jgi:hypothetical protein
VNYLQSKPSVKIFNYSEGIAFTNVESTRPTRPRAPDITKVKCYNCNKKERYSNECTDKEPEKEKETMDGLTATMTIGEENTNNYDNWVEFTFH